MNYSVLVEAYEKLEKTSKRLEKTYFISELFKKISEEELIKIIYLLQGNIFSKLDERKIGMGSRLMLKAISLSSGASIAKIEKEWANKGDLGIVAENILKKRKQTAFFSKKLTISKVFDNLQKLSELEGKGTVSKKINFVLDLLTSAKPNEAKFIIRTIIGGLRINVAEGLIRDAIVWTYFPKVIGIFFKCDKCKKIVPHSINCISCGSKLNNKFKDEVKRKYKETYSPKNVEDIKKINLKKYPFILIKDEKLAREIYNRFVFIVQDAYDKTNDFGKVIKVAKSLNFDKLSMAIGAPLNPMLAIKAESIESALKAVGNPALIEEKLDGFRLQIHKDKNGVKLFTRRLENVSKQFSELIPLIKSNIKSREFIIDSEVTGYDPETGRIFPFQYISQRIKRKYDLEKKAKEIPVRINVFDIMYKNGKSLISLSQKERRKILEGIIKEEKRKIILTNKLISGSEKEIKKFYKDSLKKDNEGIMIKSLESRYVPGRRVGGWLKMKPIRETLDLIITSAEWGQGKRANWMSSFTLSCKNKNKLFEIGKVGTGILEKKGELTFENLTKKLIPLIISEKGKKVKLKPKIIFEIAYDEIQKSKNYSSGYALRFPRVVRIRLDLGFEGVDNIERIERIYNNQKK
jgi:ATP-dependent DNA ligase I